MANSISSRLAEIVAALPLRLGMRILEIGCGPGVAARAVLLRIGNGHVTAIDLKRLVQKGVIAKLKYSKIRVGSNRFAS